MKKALSIYILLCFLTTGIIGPMPAFAQEKFRLPAPGVMVHLSPEFIPAHLQGLTIHSDNALQFDFLINRGDNPLSDEQKKKEYIKLAKYFLASLTIPEKDLWVNLSPYEKKRIIPQSFGLTEMGRDLLAEDYMLKQITASLIYPEDGLGKKFWHKVYERAWNQYHTTEIPVNTFNKVWIIPDEAAVYESGNTVYVLRNHLKVMLEEDYLSLKKHSAFDTSVISPKTGVQMHTITSKIVREIVLPELEKEVNEGKNFANLRQIYSGMILATWYKHALKESLLGKVYANKSKVKGIDQDPKANEKIYHQYLRAFKKGVFNYIKEDIDKYTNEMIPRKYFSGGAVDFASVVTGDGVTAGYKDKAVLVVDPAQTASLSTLNIDPEALALEGNKIDRASISLDTVQNITRQKRSNGLATTIGKFTLALGLTLSSTTPLLAQNLNYPAAASEKKVESIVPYKMESPGQAQYVIGVLNRLPNNVGSLGDKFKSIDANHLIKIPFAEGAPMRGWKYELNGDMLFSFFTDLSSTQRSSFEVHYSGKYGFYLVRDKEAVLIRVPGGNFLFAPKPGNQSPIEIISDDQVGDPDNPVSSGQGAVYVPMDLKKIDNRIDDFPSDMRPGIKLIPFRNGVLGVVNKQDNIKRLLQEHPDGKVLEKEVNIIENAVAFTIRNGVLYVAWQNPGKPLEFGKFAPEKDPVVIPEDMVPPAALEDLQKTLVSDKAMKSSRRDFLRKSAENTFAVAVMYSIPIGGLVKMALNSPVPVLPTEPNATYVLPKVAMEHDVRAIAYELANRLANSGLEKEWNITTERINNVILDGFSDYKISPEDGRAIFQKYWNDSAAKQEKIIRQRLFNEYGRPYGIFTDELNREWFRAVGKDLIERSPPWYNPLETPKTEKLNFEKVGLVEVRIHGDYVAHSNDGKKSVRVIIGEPIDPFVETGDEGIYDYNRHFVFIDRSAVERGIENTFPAAFQAGGYRSIGEAKSGPNTQHMLKGLSNKMRKYFEGKSRQQIGKEVLETILRHELEHAFHNRTSGDLKATVGFLKQMKGVSFNGENADWDGIATELDAYLTQLQGKTAVPTLLHIISHSHKEKTDNTYLAEAIILFEIFGAQKGFPLEGEAPKISRVFDQYSEDPKGYERFIEFLNARAQEARNKYALQPIEIVNEEDLTHIIAHQTRQDFAMKGGIDFNSSNLNLQIKRDGRGVPLPLAQQDMAQLSAIQGFEPEILEIKPAINLPILTELQQKLQPSSV